MENIGWNNERDFREFRNSYYESHIENIQFSLWGGSSRW